jgi:hypothetical protein
VLFSAGYSLVMQGISGSGLVYTTSTFRDAGSGSVTLQIEAVGTSTGSDVDLVVDPGAGVTKRLESLWVRNASGVSQTLTIALRSPGPTDSVLLQVFLNNGDIVRWGQDQITPTVVSANGVPRGIESNAISSRSLGFFKTSTAAEAAGSWYCTAKDPGTPGAIVVGTPGLSGRAVTGSPPNPEPGSLWLPAPVGQWYLTYGSVLGSVAHANMIFDLLWINSGIVVTTLGPQVINSVTLPARSSNGTTDGEGCWIGLLFTAAATNAAAIANSTISYTNSRGTPGQTATLVAVAGSQIPATPVVGTIVWFSLAAGDTGVRSIESISLNTSLVTGSVSLIIAKSVVMPPTAVPNNTGGAMIANATLPSADPGVPLWQDPAMFHAYQASATTATTIAGQLVCVDRA